MPTVLELKAKERSTYVVTASFKDESGTPVVPDSIKWTLSDNVGKVVNGRRDVVIGSPAVSVNIILFGEDLQIFNRGKEETRIVTVEATYTSGGQPDLPLNDQVVFQVYNLPEIK